MNRNLFGLIVLTLIFLFASCTISCTSYTKNTVLYTVYQKGIGYKKSLVCDLENPINKTQVKRILLKNWWVNCDSVVVNDIIPIPR